MTAAGTPPALSIEQQQSAPRRRRLTSGGNSVLAQCEPMIWLNGGALVVCVVMILGLLLLILYQGAITFWPQPVVQVRTVEGSTYLGEITRRDSYLVGYVEAERLSPAVREIALDKLDASLLAKLSQLQSKQRLASRVTELAPNAEQGLHKLFLNSPAAQEATAAQRRALWQSFQQFRDHPESIARVTDRIVQLLDAATGSSAAIHDQWIRWRQRRDEWLAHSSLAEMQQALEQAPALLADLWTAQTLELLSVDVSIVVGRRLLRTGNFELTGEHFTWITDLEIAPEGVSRPRWAMIFERLAWGRFYGEPVALLIDDQPVATEPEKIWQQFNELHPDIRQRWQRRRRLETVDTGEVNRMLEAERLQLKRAEMRFGKDSEQWRRIAEESQRRSQALEEEFDVIRQEINRLDEENERYKLRVHTASGVDHDLLLADIVRCYPANQLTGKEKLQVYLSRWWEFLSDSPREANSEGGVFPAIWGTVAMTLLMSVAVVPFGVLAALYLREYAKAGWAISIVRIAVNNLAGVPSIVFGVFGLGFFCYLLGATIDELFFAEKLPSPTFGTGGLLWASLTLALMTLPVVIVATEEALAAVPRSMREGSLACGATKWQTIRRIVLPRAMPGIMTGMILAMARGAGEVAPLMLVGAVKLAPELPIDTTFPYVHLERSFMHLGFHIYDLGFQSQNSEAAKPMVFTTTLLLIVLIATMNLIAIWMRSALKKKFQYSQF